MDSTLALKAMFVAMPTILLGLCWLLTRSGTVLLLGLLVMAGSGALAGAGVLAEFDALPPRLLLLLGPLALATAVLASSRFGDPFVDLSFGWLIGIQSFRLPLELMIYRAVEENVAPPQFTWTGMNYDILVGITAALLFPFAHKAPRGLLWAWNVLGFLLLANIVTVAILSTPGPLQVLSPDNTLIAHFPFIWLPTICVTTALFGHVVLTRKLLRDKKMPTRPTLVTQNARPD